MIFIIDKSVSLDCEVYASLGATLLSSGGFFYTVSLPPV